jgi:hypothetical protein
MKPSCYCTISTDGAMKDLLGLVNSLSLNMPGSKLYILSDTTSKEYIENDNFPLNIDIHWKISLDKYTGKRRNDMVKEGLWSDFQMEKTNSLLWAFDKGEEDVMFLDADIFVLRPIEFSNYNGEDVILSPHNIRKRDEDQYGKYNGGVFWTKNRDTIQTWRDHFEGSRYYDQACLEDVARLHSTYEANDGLNMSWWRVLQSDNNPNDIVKRFKVEDDGAYYGDYPLQFIHTHLYSRTNGIAMFNRLMVRLTLACKDIRNGLLMIRHVQGKWNVFIPKQPMPGMWNHKNDSFRELAKMWEVNGFANLEQIQGLGNCWFGVPGGCLLYDRPTLLWYAQDPQVKQAKISLFGNPTPEDNGKPWVFWARRPLILETQKDTFRKNDKNHNVVFIGNIENAVQGKYRSDDWGAVIDDFHLTRGSSYKFTHEEYLDRISRSKYGLCLRGFGSKCHRETELMGVGTIPIITPGVDVDSYAEPLIEDVHYVRVNKPDDITNIIREINKEKRESMSKQCIEWWERNCSLHGSFKTTLSQVFN